MLPKVADSPGSAAADSPNGADSIAGPALSGDAVPAAAGSRLAVGDSAVAPQAESGEIAESADVAADLSGYSTVEIERSFVEDSWAEIIDAREERLFYGLGQAGARASFTGAVPIAFLLGNADGVRLAVDGEAYAVPQIGRQGNLARFTLDVSTSGDASDNFSNSASTN